MSRRPGAPLAAACLLASLAACDRPLPPARETAPSAAADGACVRASVALPLLGRPGDSPIVPVSVDGHPAAMFFSPGFAPVLFSRNGAIDFQRIEPHTLGTQDGGTVEAWSAEAHGFAIGDLRPTAFAGLLLPTPETRTVAGRPLVGLLGRAFLPENAVVSLDVPGRTAIISIPRTQGCLELAETMAVAPVAMGDELLEVPARINGRRVEAVLDPDLAVSILPASMAGDLGVSEADLARDPEVRTQFQGGALGRRHRVATLEVDGTRLDGFTFDVERKVDQVMLGLNFFGRGIAVFDRGNEAFYFRQTTDAPPRPSDLHFDRTQMVRTAVSG